MGIEVIRQGKGAKDVRERQTPSQKYVDLICFLYGDYYDDREEDSRIKGEDWEPGIRAMHKSIRLFQKELSELHNIKLSRTKIQKILITGGVWTTERSRAIQELYEKLTEPKSSGGKAMKPKTAIDYISRRLNLSTVAVSINLPYEKVVYDLDEKSANAIRIQRFRAKKKAR